MRIMMLCSESVPFAKTGGLADAVPALAAALTEDGHDVRIFMPRYYGIDRGTLSPAGDPVCVPMGGEEKWCAVYRGTVSENQTPVYFLDREDLFGRAGLYGPDGSSSWPDNPLRYGTLCAAVFQFCYSSDWIPDILHLHDWQTGPAAWMLAVRERERGFSNTVSVMTIHNLGYQGRFSPSALDVFDTDLRQRDTSGLFKDESINFLAAGLNYADAITTVSPTYADEILRPNFSEGLGDVLISRAHRLHGILNGMDYTVWNPQTDKALSPDNYSTVSMSAKARVKTRLQSYMGLPTDARLPLFGVVSRLAGQKGLDLMTEPGGEAVRAFREGRAQLALLGTGERSVEEAFAHLAEAFPRNVAARITFNDALSRLIEGGSDFFLMPSRYEPCGLNQMYSLRYGTLPVVRRTGGLADTVVDLSSNPRRGTGFVFDEASPQALADAIDRAVGIFAKPGFLARVRRRGMRLRFDWKSSAGQYVEVYRQALRTNSATVK